MRNSFLIIVGWAILIGLGCSTTSTQHLPPVANLLPPHVPIETESDVESVDYYLLKAAEKQTTQEYQWWITYKRANIWKEQKPQLSCEKFANLARDPIFPLAQIAYLHAFEVCSKNASELVGLKAFNYKSFPSWMQKKALDVELSRAELNNDKKLIMELSYEKSKEYLPIETKIELTKKSLSLASELKNRTLTKKFQSRLFQLQPSENPKPSRSEWLSVAYDFRRLRNFKKADEYYKKVIRDRRFSFSQRLKAYNGLRKSYKNRRDKAGHLAITKEMAQFTNNFFKKNIRSRFYRKKFHDAHIDLARTEWTMGQRKNAGRTLAKIEKTLRKKYPMDEVFWLFGRMEEEKGDLDKSLFWFRKALKEPIKDKEFKEKVLWYEAWIARKSKQYDEAIGAFKKMIETTENDFAKSRYHFWLAKTLEDNGEQTKAQLVYQTLINEDPLGYYGLIAHRQTNQLIPANENLLKRLPSSTDDKKSLNIEKLIDVQMVEWMISLEETDLSKRYLDDVSAQFRKRNDQDDETWFKIFNYYARSGEYLSLYEQMGRLTPERRKLLLDNHPSLIFPRPYKDLVQSAATQFGISSELIYSIMRQESAFNPRARSFADAFGLLQMLPEIARKQATAANVTYEKPEDLFKPEINIPVGTSFLKKLQTRWKNQFILMVASYNANDRAIHGWLKTRYHGDTLEFIEDIPYEETRGYVRLVMRNLIFYSLLSADGEKIPFPEWVLKLDPPAST